MTDLDPRLAVIVLAAGQGTRMKSRRAKVLHPLAGVPLIGHVLATARELANRGLDEERILVSLERNMQCGTGHCGHCQLGPLLLCRDGPVVPWSRARSLTSVREL